MGLSFKNLTNPGDWRIGNSPTVKELWGDLSGATAAKEQSDAANAATQAQLAEAEKARQFQQQQAEQGYGFIDAGTTSAGLELSDAKDKALQALMSGGNQAAAAFGAAPNRLAQLYGGGLASGFQADPGYQFRQQQGEQAINRAAAAQGGRHGAATLKALADYNQNLASNEFQNYANRAMGLAGGADQNDWMRQSALANLLSGQGANIANTYTGTGSALANLYSGAGTNKANLAQGIGAGNNSLAQSAMGAYAMPVQFAGGPAQANANFGGGLVANLGGRFFDAAMNAGSNKK